MGCRIYLKQLPKADTQVPCHRPIGLHFLSNRIQYRQNNKYQNGDETATKDGKLMENDIVLYRYADVLLMKSEAKIRTAERAMKN